MSVVNYSNRSCDRVESPSSRLRHARLDAAVTGADSLGDPFLLAALLTHLTVLGIGVGGITRLVPLPRSRRSGLGLVLMALAMAALMIPARSMAARAADGAAHVALFGVALWLLVGPERRP